MLSMLAVLMAAPLPLQRRVSLNFTMVTAWEARPGIESNEVTGVGSNAPIHGTRRSKKYGLPKGGGEPVLRTNEPLGYGRLTLANSAGVAT